MAQALIPLAGSLLGGVGSALGGGKDDGETQSVTQSVTVPPFLRPFVHREAGIRTRTLERLSGQLSNAGAQNLVESLTPQQQQAIDLLTERGGGAGGFVAPAADAFRRAARGEVSPEIRDAAAGFRDIAARDPLRDPALQEATTAAVRRVLPDIASTFARSGRTGAGLERAAIGQATSDALAGLLGQERQRQLAATSALAGLGSDIDARRLAGAAALPGLIDIEPGLLLQAGGLLQAQGQREREAPIVAQERLLSAASSTPAQALFGQQGATETPLFRNPAAGALGGAIGGLQLGSRLSGLLSGGGGGSGITGDFSSGFTGQFSNFA